MHNYSLLDNFDEFLDANDVTENIADSANSRRSLRGEGATEICTASNYTTL